MKKIKLVIVDDHKILRAGLRMLFENEKNIEIVGEADNREELLKIIEERPCDIILLDISLNNENGFDIMVELTNRYPDVKIIVLTMHESAQYVKQALKYGAKGYVSKRSADKDLINAIRTVVEGGVFLDPDVAGKLSLEGSTDIRLSDREVQVLNLLVRGFTLKEIAGKLGISDKTVDTYKNRIFEKTKISSKPELLEFAIKHGYFESER